MNDQDISDRIAAYVLNTLSAEERAEVEALLARSAEAQALLRSYEAMFGGLGTLTTQRNAPEGAVERFRARLAAEAPPLPRPKRAQPFPLWAALAAAALLIIAVGVMVLLSPQTDEVVAILGDPNAVRVELTPQGTVAGTIRFVALPNTNQGVLVADLPTPAADQQYQLWFITAEGIRSGGVLEGDQPLRVSVPDPSMSYTLGITLEPRGGSQQPTSAPIFTGTLPRLQG
jgi:anti-sigma-K factor RskA